MITAVSGLRLCQGGAMTTVSVRRSTPADAPRIAELLLQSWGDTRVVNRGRLRDASTMPAFIAERDGEAAGLLTYAIDATDLEIVTIDARVQHAGTGTALINAAGSFARQAGCRRVWLTTTNDNIDALRFYQRRGFALVALRPGALNRTRELKAVVPLTGYYGIPLMDELDLAMPLT